MLLKKKKILEGYQDPILKTEWKTTAATQSREWRTTNPMQRQQVHSNMTLATGAAVALP